MTPIVNAENAMTMTTAKPTPSTTTGPGCSPQADAAWWSLSDTAAGVGFLPDAGSNGPTLSVFSDIASASISEDEDVRMLDIMQKC